MSQVYLLKNQHNAYLDKSNEWVTCGDRKQLLRTPHKDEVINLKVEFAVKHPDLRIEAVQVDLDERGLPNVELPKPQKVEKTLELPLEDSPLSEENSEQLFEQKPPIEKEPTDV